MSSHRLTTSAGDQVTFDRHGAGPSVVFVAGAGPFRAIDPATTAAAAGLAEQGLGAVVHDRVGRADSFRPGRVDLDDEVAALAALLDVVDGPAVLCGHSSGGAIALRAAAAGLPVAGIVLFEAPLDPAAPGTEAWAETLYALLDVGDHAGAVRHYMKDIPMEVLQGLEQSPLWEPFVAHAESLRVDAEAIAWALHAMADDGLAEVDVPVRVLVGQETFAEMPAAAAALAAVLPQATRGEVAGAQHSWDPGAMVQELSTFLRAVG